jgi:hypothetical protein
MSALKAAATNRQCARAGIKSGKTGWEDASRREPDLVM